MNSKIKEIYGRATAIIFCCGIFVIPLLSTLVVVVLYQHVQQISEVLGILQVESNLNSLREISIVFGLPFLWLAVVWASARRITARVNNMKATEICEKQTLKSSSIVYISNRMPGYIIVFGASTILFNTLAQLSPLYGTNNTRHLLVLLAGEHGVGDVLTAIGRAQLLFVAYIIQDALNEGGLKSYVKLSMEWVAKVLRRQGRISVIPIAWRRLVAGSIFICATLVTIIAFLPNQSYIQEGQVYQEEMNSSDNPEILWAAILACALWFVCALSRANEYAESGFRSKPANQSKRVEYSILLCAFTVSLSSICLFVTKAPQMQWSFTAFGVAMIAVIFWTTISVTLFDLIPEKVGISPWLVLVCLISLVIWGGVPQNEVHVVRGSKALDFVPITDRWKCMNESEARIRREFDDYLSDWIRQRTKDASEFNKIDLPMYFIIAAGGGKRASNFSGYALSELDEATNGEFGDHIFFVSAVSGSSVGVASWALARRASTDIVGKRDLLSAFFIQTAFLNHDWISPILSYFLLTDVIQSLSPIKLFDMNRGDVLEKTWETSWVEAVSRMKSPKSIPPMGMLSGLQAKADSNVPILIFNASELNSGRRYIVSNASLPQSAFVDSYLATDPCGLPGVTDLPLSAAVHLSARFPLLSPPGLIKGRMDDQGRVANASRYNPFIPRGPEEMVPWGQVVDGGYVDNSGASTASDFLRLVAKSLEKMRQDKTFPNWVTIRPIGISLINDPVDTSLQGIDEVVWEEAVIDSNGQLERKKRAVGGSEWPVAGSPLKRELLASSGRPMSIAKQISTDNLPGFLGGPVVALLNSRENRALQEERRFFDEISILSRRLSSISGASPANAAINFRLGGIVKTLYQRQRDHLIPGLYTSVLHVSGTDDLIFPPLVWELSDKSNSVILDSVGSMVQDDPLRAALFLKKE